MGAGGPLSDSRYNCSLWDAIATRGGLESYLQEVRVVVADVLPRDLVLDFLAKHLLPLFLVPFQEAPFQVLATRFDYLGDFF